jgi:phosphoglycolate phosphatase
MIRLIAFDLDGTLIDSRRDIADAANRLLHSYDAPPLPLDAILAMVGEGARLLVTRVLTGGGVIRAHSDGRTATAEIAADGAASDGAPSNGGPSNSATSDGAHAASGDEPIDSAFIDDALARFIEIYERNLVEHTRLYPGVAEMLATLGHGRQLAVLTNKPRRPAVEILDHFGLLDRFVEVIGGDGPLGRKPDPTGLLSLATRAGARPDETMMIGDSWVDVETARQAGAHPVFVTFGFGEPPKDGFRPGEIQIHAAGELPAVVTQLEASAQGVIR